MEIIFESEIIFTCGGTTLLHRATFWELVSDWKPVCCACVSQFDWQDLNCYGKPHLPCLHLNTRTTLQKYNCFALYGPGSWSLLSPLGANRPLHPLLDPLFNNYYYYYIWAVRFWHEITSNNSISAPATLSKWRNFKGVILTAAGFVRRKVWGISGHGSGVSWGGSIQNNKRLCDIIEPRDGRPSHIFPDQYVCSLLSPLPERQMT